MASSNLDRTMRIAIVGLLMLAPVVAGSAVATHTDCSGGGSFSSLAASGLLYAGQTNRYYRSSTTGGPDYDVAAMGGSVRLEVFVDDGGDCTRVCSSYGIAPSCDTHSWHGGSTHHIHVTYGSSFAGAIEYVLTAK